MSQAICAILETGWKTKCWEQSKFCSQGIAARPLLYLGNVSTLRLLSSQCNLSFILDCQIYWFLESSARSSKGGSEFIERLSKISEAFVKVSEPAFPFHSRVLQHVGWVEPTGQNYLINWCQECEHRFLVWSSSINWNQPGLPKRVSISKGRIPHCVLWVSQRCVTLKHTGSTTVFSNEKLNGLDTWS